MAGLAGAAMALAMISAFVLAFFGIKLVRGLAGEGREERQRGWLMIAAALVLVANVLIWTV